MNKWNELKNKTNDATLQAAVMFDSNNRLSISGSWNHSNIAYDGKMKMFNARIETS